MNNTNSLALILIAVGVSFFFTKPMLADLYTALDQRQSYQDKLVQVRTIQDVQKGLQNKLDDLSPEDKIKVDTLLPDSADITKFISDVDTLASKNGITMETFSYTAAVNNAGQSVGDEVASTNGIDKMTVSLGFKTDYVKLKKFISDLESSLRIIDIRSIDSDGGVKGVFNYRIDLEIYWLKK